MSKKDNEFIAALEGKKVPTLTLDHKWYRLFRGIEKTKEIERIEAEQKEWLLEQGKVNSEMAKLRVLKNQLMDEIVTLMDASDAASKKKMDGNRRLIDEINEKMELHQDAILDIPVRIDELNHELMLLTMEQCYGVIKSNTSDISELTDLIDEMRVELKKNIVRKQEMEVRNVEMYSYMHDIFGPDVVELFDIQYDIEGKRQEILEKQRLLKEKKEQEKDA